MAYAHITPRASEIPPLRLASWNLENFGISPGSRRDKDKASRIGWGIVGNMDSPHLIAVQEMCDDSGHLDDGTTSAQKNAQLIINAIANAGGPHYEYIEVAPEDNKDGGRPGSNIRCGFFYRPDRLALAQPQGQGAPVQLGENPTLIAPTSESFTDSRKPLLAHFTDRLTNEDYLVTNLHLASDGMQYRIRTSSVPAAQRTGAWEPNPERLKQRIEQAEVICDYLRPLRERTTDRCHLVVCGDFNTATHTRIDGKDEPAQAQPKVLEKFEQLGLHSAGDRLGKKQFSHREGNMSMTLDYIYTTPELSKRIKQVQRPRLNEGTRGDRISDHNPTVISVTAPKKAIEPAAPGRGR